MASSGSKLGLEGGGVAGEVIERDLGVDEVVLDFGSRGGF